MPSPPMDQSQSTSQAHVGDLYTYLSTRPQSRSGSLELLACRFLGIPERARQRSGLRKVHARMTEISGHLSDTADAAYTRQDWRIIDVILDLWVCLCADAALKRDLLQDGLVPMTLRLINTGVNHALLVQLFELLAQDDARSVKIEILDIISAVLTRRRPSWCHYETRTSVSIVVALYHCLDAILSLTSDTSTTLSIEFILSVIAFNLEIFQQPRVSYKTVLYAIPLLILCVRSCPAERMESMGPALEFLAVLTGSHNIRLRCAIAWIFSVLGPTPPSAAQPGSSGAGQVHFPHLAASRARPGGESALIKECARASLTLVWLLAKDGDFRRFGIGIADVLMRG
ncbi:hypothetical protein OH76DRAFT_512649 [Lentinus brumalis]|uniref:Uncharacterized protein n=1 Tax=Lentinus brumalis TaxID=2498619 RepID=A0A371DB92_9APHY|nr:hypothetical protein OH76DRAFT_512649 [Polyporus brumalis]